MKIAIVDLLFNWPPDGGARTDLKEMMDRLSKNNTVRLFVPSLRFRGRNAEQVVEDVKKIQVSPLTFNAFCFPQRLRKEIDDFSPDLIVFADGWYLKAEVINSFLDYPYIVRFYAYEGLCLIQHGTFLPRGVETCQFDYLSYGWRGWWRCTYCSLKWQYRFRNILFSHEYLMSLSFLPRHRKRVIASLENARAIICYNNFARNMMSPYNENVHVIPGGINLNEFNYRESINEGKTETNILMVGRASDPSKGFSVLKKAFGLLKEKYPNITLTVTTHELTDEITETEGVQATGWLTQEELPSLYSTADICVVPSLWQEPFGIVALEAMASGVPVIVSEVGGLQHIVEDEISGFVVPPGDHICMAEKIEMLLTSKELYRQIRDNAYERVKTYTWDDAFEKFNNVISQSIDSPLECI